MKLTQEDNTKIKAALVACKMADIELAVISEGKIRGMSESKNAAIISELSLSIDPQVTLGVTRLGELEKRLALFKDVTIEGELNADKKVKRLTIKGSGSSKIEFRCTDIALLDRKYPKSHNDVPFAELTFTKEEVQFFSKAVRTLGAEQLTIQIKKDGAVRIESSDSSNDRFEYDIAAQANFADDPTSMVRSYSTTSTGVLLKLLDYLARDSDTITVNVMSSGNLALVLGGFTILAIPRIL